MLIIVTGLFLAVPATGTRFSLDALVAEDSRPADMIGSSGSLCLDEMTFVQTPSDENQVYYLCRRGISAVAYFGESEVYYVVGSTLIRLEFPGSRRVVPVGEEPTGSVTNYLYGNDPSLWKTGLTDYALLRYAEIYPGINLVYRFLDGNLKYEFIIAPHADPNVVRLSYPDADRIEIYDDHVTVSKDGFSFTDAGLLAFQKGVDVTDVDCAFYYQNTCTMGFRTWQYDVCRELVIDPTVLLVYSTFLGGGSSDYGYAIAVESGYAYVTGYTLSSGFPTVNAYDATLGGVADCFVTKLSVDGQSLVYSTFLGGTSNEYGRGIAAESGCAYVTGYTVSSDFPTANAYDPTYNGGDDCFVTKLAADGQSLVYSTFLGGTSGDNGYGIAVESGCAYVTGQTLSSGFPTVNAYDSTLSGSSDCFVTRLAADGQSLVYSTFLGGTSNEQGWGIAVESGCAYVTGYTQSSDFPTVLAYDSTHNGGNDAFVTKLAANGQSLVYSTFLGGASTDYGNAIAVENGFAYVTGRTLSSDFPTANAYDATHNGGDDCFVAKLTADGQSLVYSTFLGGASNDSGRAIAVESGYVCVTGETYSSGFPAVNAYDSSYNGELDCFVTELAADGQSLVYSTFLGGASNDYGNGIVLEGGCVYVVGLTLSSAFPIADAYDSTHNGGIDCFVAIIAFDTDMDGLSDWAESMYGTDPSCIDTDNDNFLDGYEVAYGSDPMDPMSYPAMPQVWYEAIYEDLDGNATLIQNLIAWSNGNATLLQSVMQQLDTNATMLEQVISWLDGNHTAIETLFTYVNGNATLLMQTVMELNSNATQLELVAALATQNSDRLALLNASYIGSIDEIRAVLDKLGVTVGDTDYDGLDDLQELALGTDLQCIDTDCDNLNDAYEVKIGTDPTDDDSDNDTYYDGAEVLAGTDPLDSLDYPGSTGSTTTTTTEPDMGIGLIIVAGVAGCAAIIVLLVVMRRRTGVRS